jgi:hypothetical protein
VKCYDIKCERLRSSNVGHAPTTDCFFAFGASLIVFPGSGRVLVVVVVVVAGVCVGDCGVVVVVAAAAAAVVVVVVVVVCCVSDVGVGVVVVVVVVVATGVVDSTDDFVSLAMVGGALDNNAACEAATFDVASVVDVFVADDDDDDGDDAIATHSLLVFKYA